MDPHWGTFEFFETPWIELDFSFVFVNFRELEAKYYEKFKNFF